MNEEQTYLEITAERYEELVKAENTLDLARNAYQNWDRYKSYDMLDLLLGKFELKIIDDTEE